MLTSFVLHVVFMPVSMFYFLLNIEFIFVREIFKIQLDCKIKINRKNGHFTITLCIDWNPCIGHSIPPTPCHVDINKHLMQFKLKPLLLKLKRWLVKGIKLSSIHSSHKTLVLLIRSLLLVALIDSPHMMIHPISFHLNLLVVDPVVRGGIPAMKVLFLASIWWILDQYLALNGQRNATETVISTVKFSTVFVINKHH